MKGRPVPSAIAGKHPPATLCLATLFLLCAPLPSVAADDPSPPSTPVKLVFVHHSVGENWLADGNGDLGAALGRNDYFVSDSNFGWGPDAIGDRTDITDWPSWLTGPRSATYTQALYRLSSANSPYTRAIPDPGGENRIVMFKSCFPNSELEGHPGDPPRREGGLTVGNAKAIYRELLGYFASRPDKLFIAVTAPPALDPRLGHNARAFNNWLVDDWLKDYQGQNVAVFDFYNVLTGPANHHRYHNGRIEHLVAASRNTLYYLPGDDAHPTPEGSRKATAEFVPLLNVYYHRWQAWLPSAPAATSAVPAAEPIANTAEEESAQEPPPPPTACEPCTGSIPVEPGGLIDDFDGTPKGWEVFSDEGQPKTRLTCGAEPGESFNGETALAIRYEIAPGSWAICSLVLPTVESWSQTRGISLRLRTERPGQALAIVAYGGEFSDRLTHYEHSVVASADNIGRWQKLDLTWDRFVQPPWEGDGTARFDPAKTKGLAFGFSDEEGSLHQGALWVDDIRFLE